VKVFGKKLKETLGSSIKFLFELLDPRNFTELDRQIYEMSNQFRLKDYEILISDDYEVHSILENLREKAGISGDIILGKNISLENVIRRLVPPTPKEKVQYVLALKEAASGKLNITKDRIKLMESNVGSGCRFVGFSTTNSDGIETVLYDRNRGIGIEEIDFKKFLRYKGLWDSETIENIYCKLYEPKEQKECKNPQKKCKNCSVYHGFKGSGRLYERKTK